MENRMNLFICRLKTLVFLYDCPIWSGALYIIREKVSEVSSEQELLQCYIWIGEQQDKHWRKHLYGWLKYIKRNKKEIEKEVRQKEEVSTALKKFHNIYKEEVE